MQSGTSTSYLFVYLKQKQEKYEDINKQIVKLSG